MISFKRLAPLLAFLAAPAAIAQTTQTVLVRGHKARPVLEEIPLQDLVSDREFEGRHFRIVLGKEDRHAISLSEPDEELRLRAATAYHHLTEARRYWVETLGSDYVRKLPTITVRLDLTNSYSELAHYYHDEIEPQYNDALSIPAGTPMRGLKDVRPWGPEIWFRPKKVIPVDELPPGGLNAHQNPMSQYLMQLSEPLESALTSRLLQNTLIRLFMPNVPQQHSLLASIARTAGTIAVTRLILAGSRKLDRWFLEKYYYMDSAMVPEIVQHEFAHIAMSDALTLSHSTPVVEGLADYFATSAADRPMIADKMRAYSRSMPKNGRSKAPYNPLYELNVLANSDFVLSVLWSVRDELPETADRLVYEARKSLNTASSTIRHDLIRALLDACTRVCTDPRADRLRLRGVFEARGF